MLLVRQFFALIGTSFLLFSGMCSAGESDDREAIVRSVHHALNTENFAAIEALGVPPNHRTSSGIWISSLVLIGIDSYLGFADMDAQRWERIQVKLKAWMMEYPSSTTPHIAYARGYISRAWNIRGPGMASSVQEKDWEPFKRNVQLARKYLEDRKSTLASDPRSFQLMVWIATMQSWPQAEFDLLINEAMSKFPNYYSIYFSAVVYYSPMWGGEAAKFDEFARKATRASSASDGNAVYTRIYWSKFSGSSGHTIFTSSAADWPLMKSGFEDIVKAFPSPWNLNSFAKYACIAKDKATTKLLIDTIGKNQDRSAWFTYKMLDECKDWANDVPSEFDTIKAPQPFVRPPGAYIGPKP